MEQEKRTFRTCAEHEHCQEEIIQSVWDDKENTFTVIHHRNAEEQPDSPVSPERFIKASELLGHLDRIERATAELANRAALHSGAVVSASETAIATAMDLAARSARLDSRAKDMDVTRADLGDLEFTIGDLKKRVYEIGGVVLMTRRERRKYKKARA